jgi:hypothetical protein
VLSQNPHGHGYVTAYKRVLNVNGGATGIRVSRVML